MPTPSLTDASTLLVRNIEHFRKQRLLLVNGPGDQVAAELAEADSEVFTLSSHYGYHQSYANQSRVTEARFAPLPASEWQPFDAIILYWPKEKALANLLIEQLTTYLTQEGALYLVGENKGGIKSAANVLKKRGLTSYKLDAARHCSLLSAVVPEGNTVESPQLESYQSQLEISVDHQPLTLAAFPGVFSSGRLDEGTRLLLDHLPQTLGTHILDFGCGCGVISAAIAKADPQRKLTAVDVNALALQTTQQTFKLNQVSGKTLAVTGVETLKGMKFDTLVTNPPFHQGVSTHYTVTEQLIAQAPTLLHKGGQLILVANKFLKYEPLLKQAFNQVEVLASTNKFVVYRCVHQ